jgi:hypothetical protein
LELYLILDFYGYIASRLLIIWDLERIMIWKVEAIWHQEGRDGRVQQESQE